MIRYTLQAPTVRMIAWRDRAGRWHHGDPAARWMPLPVLAIEAMRWVAR